MAGLAMTRRLKSMAGVVMELAIARAEATPPGPVMKIAGPWH